jgi:hypothetical protein
VWLTKTSGKPRKACILVRFFVLLFSSPLVPPIIELIGDVRGFLGKKEDKVLQNRQWFCFWLQGPERLLSYEGYANNVMISLHVIGEIRHYVYTSMPRSDHWGAHPLLLFCFIDVLVAAEVANRLRCVKNRDTVQNHKQSATLLCFQEQVFC